jgi:undecaprenyl-diphosphatase
VTILQAVLLGLVQGFTEFLPVSSSGHLVLAQHLLNIENPEIFSFDVYVHFGTLISIFVVFWKDVYDILVALWQSLKTMQFKKSF